MLRKCFPAVISRWIFRRKHHVIRRRTSFWTNHGILHWNTISFAIFYIPIHIRTSEVCVQVIATALLAPPLLSVENKAYWRCHEVRSNLGNILDKSLEWFMNNKTSHLHKVHWKMRCFPREIMAARRLHSRSHRNVHKNTVLVSKF